jgi:tRNA (guanine-N7-)-methyltransferase
MWRGGGRTHGGQTRSVERTTAAPVSVRRAAVTFKARRRALSPARQVLVDAWMARWGIDEAGPPIDWTEVFGPAVPPDALAADRDADHPATIDRVVLEIGFGHGESTVRMAAAEPHVGVVGVEIHTPGVATLLAAVDHAGLDNVRVVHGDVLVFLDRVRANSLHGIRVFFPDPWPKVRQQHRRLVGADVVAALTDRLAIGGSLHLATDVADYAEQMRRVAAAEPRLHGGVIERPPSRPLTRFEQRGLDEARVATDLVYVRRT